MDANAIKQNQLAKFHREIQTLKQGGLSTLEAIVEFCESRDLDVEDVRKFINASMLADIQEEAIQMNQVKKDKFSATIKL